MRIQKKVRQSTSTVERVLGRALKALKLLTSHIQTLYAQKKLEFIAQETLK